MTLVQAFSEGARDQRVVETRASVLTQVKEGGVRVCVCVCVRVRVCVWRHTNTATKARRVANGNSHLQLVQFILFVLPFIVLGRFYNHSAILRSRADSITALVSDVIVK